LVDTQGLLLAAEVTSAQKRDRHIFPELLRHFSSKLPKQLHVWADYATELKTKYGIDLEIVGTLRPKGYWCRKDAPEIKIKPREFKVQKRRWVVERTFAWMGRNRRLCKDYEYLPENSTAYLYLAMSGLMLRRIKKCL
jgi:putative transposase